LNDQLHLDSDINNIITMHKKSPPTESKPDTPRPENERRHALKRALLVGGIAGGASALPASWKRPVIDSIILPSHAETTTPEAANLGTEEPPAPEPEIITTNYYTDQMQQFRADARPATEQNIATRILDTVISSASAGTQQTLYYICIAITGDTYTGKIIALRYNNYYDEYDGIVGVVDSSGTHRVTDQHCVGNTGMPDIDLMVSNVSDSSCLCTISEPFFDGPTEITVPANPCSSPRIECFNPG